MSEVISDPLWLKFPENNPTKDAAVIWWDGRRAWLGTYESIENDDGGMVTRCNSTPDFYAGSWDAGDTEWDDLRPTHFHLLPNPLEVSDV